jgi:predicted nucleic acid-binding Zn ribbon protein
MAEAKKTAIPLASVLAKVLESIQSDGKPTQEQIAQVWARVAGEEAARHSWPKKLQQLSLVVEVENSGWIYTLNLRKAQLLEGLVELLGTGTVRRLEFRIGERKNG